MADFSKQYCELNDMGFDGDFDVYEEWSKLKPGFTVAYICEGFGFLAIGKRESGDEVIVYLNDKWVNFDDMIVKVNSKT
jgi:hypothetical protein